MMFFYSLKILMLAISFISVSVYEKVYASDVLPNVKDDDASSFGSALTHDEYEYEYDDIIESEFFPLSLDTFSQEHLNAACTGYCFDYACKILSNKNSCNIKSSHIFAVIDFVIKRKKRELTWIPVANLNQKRKDAWIFFDMCLEKHTDAVCSILNTREFWCKAIDLPQKSFNVLIKNMKKHSVFNEYQIKKILTKTSNNFYTKKSNLKKMFEEKLTQVGKH